MTSFRAPLTFDHRHPFPSGPRRAVLHAAELPRFSLRVVHGSPPRSEVISRAERLVIGRSPPADFCLDHPSVAEAHCEIVADARGFVLKDLGSDSGTRVAGMRVRDAYLPRETRIIVGGVELEFNVVAEDGPTASGFGGLIGEAEVMRAVFHRLARVAARETTLLLEGESGTGKRAAAEAVHAESVRRHAPFVSVDCRSERSSLLELELFGEAREAGDEPPSGSRPGAFLRAHGGTLFLDEIAELGIDLQRRLLRVMEHHEVVPMGSTHARLVDVRVVAATSRNLQREIGRGTFREDLYYALAVASVRLPALRERVSDIPLLVRSFLKEHSLRDGVAYSLDQSSLERFALRPWPGNVRELRNAVETVLALGTDENPPSDPPRPVRVDVPFKTAKARLVESFERDYLISIMAQYAGNITAAASAAGVDRVHFLRLLDRYRLRKSRPRVRLAE